MKLRQAKKICKQPYVIGKVFVETHPKLQKAMRRLGVQRFRSDPVGDLLRFCFGLQPLDQH